MTESRFNCELRAEISGNRLTGHAAVFGQYAALPGHLESLAHGAFDAALADKQTDVRALYNHDPSMLLGRQSAGTLRVSVDSEGLPFDLDIPNTSYGNDIRELVGRGDLSGASFGFVPGADTWSRKGGHQIRTHTSVARLVDVSVVTFPAYSEASVMLRSLDNLPAAESGRSQLVRARARILIGGK